MQNKKLSFLLLLTAGLSLSAQAMNDKAYAVDSSGAVVKTGYGDCLRANHQSAGTKFEQCGDVIKLPDADNDGVADGKDKCPGTASGVSVDAMGCAKDSDNDGVADSNDRCPGTAAGTRVDSNGCAVDSDNDGVADSSDQCPGTAKGIKVDAKGCALDSDNDGIADSNDKCPGTEANVTVNNHGCAIDMDTDNDGIMNANDSCPGTAAGIAVDTTGCELKADIKLDNVQFKSGTADLSGESQNILDNIAQTLKENQHLNFEVAGHTDNRGDYNFNVNLSEKRAQSVRQYLVDKGVAADRLTARGYGPDRPVATNDSRDGRSQNRRVNLMLK